MQKEFRSLSLHQKMVVLVTELVEKELPIKEALRFF